MKKKYEVPEIEVILFLEEDIIATSGDDVEVDWDLTDPVPED